MQFELISEGLRSFKLVSKFFSSFISIEISLWQSSVTCSRNLIYLKVNTDTKYC